MNEASNLISLFGWKIPIALFAAIVGLVGTLLGALIAACIALLVNLISNKQQNKRLQVQLQHDAEQKERDRQQNAKREIYLEAAVEVAKAAKYLHKTFDLKMPPDELEALLAGYDAAIAKVHLVGGLKTIKSLEAANECFQAQVLQLHKVRAPYLHKIEQVKAIQTSMGEDFQMQQNLVGRFDQVQRSNPNDPELAGLSEKYSLVRSRIEQAQELRKKLEQEIYEGTLVVYEKSQAAARDYSEKLRLANIAAREELALSFLDDGSEYLNFLQSSADRHAKRISEFLSETHPTHKSSKPSDRK